MYCGYLEEGDNCPECKSGKLDWVGNPDMGGCSCHINPPCGFCTNKKLTCENCGYADDPEPERPIMVAPGLVMIERPPRPLDSTKIDYRVKMHTNSSQLVEGVYPEGTTQEEVRRRVNGSFGGRFEQFGGGKFRFVAYTD